MTAIPPFRVATVDSEIWGAGDDVESAREDALESLRAHRPEARVKASQINTWPTYRPLVEHLQRDCGFPCKHWTTEKAEDGSEYAVHKPNDDDTEDDPPPRMYR